MRISDWSSDVCSSDLVVLDPRQRVARGQGRLRGLARSAELRREGPAEARPGGLAGGYPFLRMIASSDQGPGPAKHRQKNAKPKSSAASPTLSTGKQHRSA